jgi:hypothetical protein
MKAGRCPECDAVPSAHLGGFGRGAECSLREDGVLDRIAQYEADQVPQTQTDEKE